MAHTTNRVHACLGWALWWLAPLAHAETLPLDAAPIVRSASRVAELSPALQSRATRLQAPLRFRALGMHWAGSGPAPAEAGISVRFSPDAETWTRWMLPRIDPDLASGDARDAWFALVLLDAPQRWVEYAIAEPWLDAGVALAFEFIDPGESGAGPRAVAPAAASAPPERPAIVSRNGWGCPDGPASPAWLPAYTDVTHEIVHHSGTSNVSDDWPAVVRSIWTFHTFSRDWGDIGYHYLIDPLGVVYEGRAGGDDVIGAHFSCQNSHTMGVALLGDYESVPPTPAALASLVQLLARKVDASGLDPLGVAEHPGTHLLLDTISGHRDGNESPTVCSHTSCPGDTLYALLPEIRIAVANAIGVPEPDATPACAAALGMLAALGRWRAARRHRGPSAPC